MKMRKGDLVKLDPNNPEISDILGWSNHGGTYIASRPTTPEEREEWNKQRSEEIRIARENGEDTFSIAFNDAGESRLAPRSVSVHLPVDGTYVVERARCRVHLGWGQPTGGMTKILDTKTGNHAYVYRDMLKVIS